MTRIPCGVSVSAALSNSAVVTSAISVPRDASAVRRVAPRGLVASCGDARAPTSSKGDFTSSSDARTPSTTNNALRSRALRRRRSRANVRIRKVLRYAHRWNVSCPVGKPNDAERTSHETYTDRVGVRSEHGGMRDLHAAGSADGDRVRPTDQRAAADYQGSRSRAVYQRARGLDREARG